MANIFKLSGYIVDPENRTSVEGITNRIGHYDPNVFSRHLHIESGNIGDWSDELPINDVNCDLAECEKYFSSMSVDEDIVRNPRFVLLTPGSRWLHFKGEEITVLDIAQDSEAPGSYFVIYKEDDKVWSRPLGMFLSEVDHEKYPEEPQKYRFEFLSDKETLSEQLARKHEEFVLPWELRITRADILHEAETCVCGHREQDYGTPEDNFTRIARFWTDYIGHELTALDVANMMVLFKMARTMTNGGTKDTYVDMAGYAACAGEIACKPVDKVSD